MDSGIIALIGAAIGASSGIGGSWISFRLQQRNEHFKWLRDKKQEAYSNALRYLFWVKYKRSKIFADGFTSISKEDTKEWFDEIISVIDGLSALSIIAPLEYKKNISQQATQVREQLEGLFYSEGKGSVSIPSFIKSVDELEQAVKDTATRDILGSGEINSENSLESSRI